MAETTSVIINSMIENPSILVLIYMFSDIDLKGGYIVIVTLDNMPPLQSM